MCKSDKAAQVCIAVAANILTGCLLACARLRALEERMESRLGVREQVDMNEDRLYVPCVESEIKVPRHVPSRSVQFGPGHTAERLIPKTAVRVETGMEQSGVDR